MKNNIKCPNCNSENPYFALNCINCKFLLRDKIVNIELWKTISLLIETPLTAFHKITFSENKNFIYGILFFLGIKIWILSAWFGLIFNKEVNPIYDFYKLILFSFIAAVLSILIPVSKLAVLLKIKKNNFRFKDIYSTTIYSFIPIVFSVLILFPLEIIVFGEYLFSINPSPFEIKNLFAYIFISLEIGFIIWSFCLLIISIKYHTQRKLLSVLFSKAILISFLFFSFLVSILYYKYQIL